MSQPFRSTKRILAHCSFLLAVGMTPALAGDPTGDWLVEDGVAHIRVAACQGSMWGAVSWEKTPGGRDTNNPDVTKQSRPTLGMPILLDMKKKKGAADQWAGQIYNSKDGKLYDSTMTLTNPDELEVQGCVLGFLCGGQTWTRVSGPIPSSPSNDPAPAAAKEGTKGTKAAKAAPPKTAPPAHKGTAGKAPPKGAGHKGSATPTDAADPVGDICLLPGIARTPH
ncbi:MAG: DUF2147 domain-containing protein [Xanthobacteraceae bacterium]|nr:DUF2147 domain-containing protein [Xanthobacteraceae bacterium]